MEPRVLVTHKDDIRRERGSNKLCDTFQPDVTRK